MVPWAIPDPTPEVSLRDIITTRRLLEVQQILDKLADFMAKVNRLMRGSWCEADLQPPFPGRIFGAGLDGSIHTRRRPWTSRSPI